MAKFPTFKNWLKENKYDLRDSFIDINTKAFGRKHYDQDNYDADGSFLEYAKNEYKNDLKDSKRKTKKVYFNGKIIGEKYI